MNDGLQDEHTYTFRLGRRSWSTTNEWALLPLTLFFVIFMIIWMIWTGVCLLLHYPVKVINGRGLVTINGHPL